MSGHSKWANIKHKKGRMDAAKANASTKIAREITIAVRMGGSDDPTGNTKLRLALQKARASNIPKDNIQRAVQKGLGANDGASYEEMTYEGYGVGGVAVIVETLTDNRNRTAADVRHIFSKYGGNMGETGCVGWMFKRKGLFAVEKSMIVSEEELMLLVLEAGAEDVADEGEVFEIITAPADFEAVEQALVDNKIEVANSEISLLPDNEISLVGDEAVKLQKMIDALDELDDVQEVYTNVNLEE